MPVSAFDRSCVMREITSQKMSASPRLGQGRGEVVKSSHALIGLPTMTPGTHIAKPRSNRARGFPRGAAVASSHLVPQHVDRVSRLQNPIAATKSSCPSAAPSGATDERFGGDMQYKRRRTCPTSATEIRQHVAGAPCSVSAFVHRQHGPNSGNHPARPVAVYPRVADSIQHMVRVVTSGSSSSNRRPSLGVSCQRTCRTSMARGDFGLTSRRLH